MCDIFLQTFPRLGTHERRGCLGVDKEEKVGRRLPATRQKSGGIDSAAKYHDGALVFHCFCT